MKLLAYDPFPDHAFIAAHNIQLLSWDELVRAIGLFDAAHAGHAGSSRT